MLNIKLNYSNNKIIKQTSRVPARCGGGYPEIKVSWVVCYTQLQHSQDQFLYELMSPLHKFFVLSCHNRGGKIRP